MSRVEVEFMFDWTVFIELVTGFSVIILSFCFLLLVKFSLDWLPSKNNIIFLLTGTMVLKSSVFSLELFNNTVSLSLYITTLPLLLLLGPVMTSFTQSTLRMEQRPILNKKSILILSIGYVLVSPFLITSVGAFSEAQTNLMNILTSISILFFVVLFTINSSYHFLPILWGLSRGALYSVGYGENTYHWLRGIWLSMSMVWLMLVIDLVMGLFDYYPPWHNVLFSILDVLIWFSLLGYTMAYCRKPRQAQEVERCQESVKYKSSALTHDLAKDIINDVEKLMQTQELYLDNNISLDKVASLINTQPQYLSQAINQYLEVNFHEYLAKYRIEFAKVELVNNPKTNIIDVAMASGFNAKSTFNLTFKKLTGLTPSAFRKQQTRHL